MGSIGDFTRYADTPETTADLNWADLITIDLSQFDTPGGKQRLAAQLKNAISTVGFFYVINFGLSEEEVNEQFAVAKQIFDLPAEEKQRCRVGTNGLDKFGWKPRGSRKQQHGLTDNLELYDDPKWNDHYQNMPRLAPPSGEQFQRHMANHVLKRLLVLCAIIMELEDEEALWKLHDYESVSQCHLRYMLYHPRTAEELAIMKKHNIEHNVYGHTDFVSLRFVLHSAKTLKNTYAPMSPRLFQTILLGRARHITRTVSDCLQGSLTLLMRQPVAALQVRPYGETEWKWVKPLRGSITVNVADSLSFLTGGYLESSIHRVVLPPEDQRDVPRYGVIYFSGPDDDVMIEPMKSPLLEREKVQNNNRAMPPKGVTVAEWMDIRFKSIDANYANNKDNKVVVKSVEVPSWAQ
jgi:isopenicillin N synthase-like dioxygenase